MSNEFVITDGVIQEFIREELNFNDVGYLVVPDDKRLNDEAVCAIRKSFKDFIERKALQPINQTRK